MSSQPGPMRSEIRVFGPFHFDESECELRKHGVRIRLGRQPFQLLTILIRRPGELVTRDELRQELWDGTTFVDFDHSLNAAVNRLRQALGDSTGRPQYIETVPGRGYRFIAPIDCPESKPLPIIAPEAELVPSSELRGQPPWKGWRIVALIVVVIAISAGGYWAVPANSSSRTEPITAIAVMPFAIAGEDEELGLLTDGLSESLIDSLSSLPGIKVIARSSAFKFKGRKVEPREVAQALGVQVILEGRVSRRGNNLGVRVDLIDVRTQTHLWGKNYERLSADILPVEEEIVREVTANLRQRLASAQVDRLKRGMTGNEEAYRHYLMGMFHSRRQDLEGTRRALGYFNTAVSLDPEFALVFARMTDIYSNLGAAGALDRKLALARAKESAYSALRLDEMLAEAHGAVAIVKLEEWDFKAAEIEFKRALELKPNLAGTHSDYAIYLTMMGRFEEALTENRQAQELSPLNVAIKDQEARILNGARRYDEALQKLRSLLEVDPDSPFVRLGLAQAYLGKRMYPEAIREYKEHSRKFSPNGEATRALIDIGYAYALSGQRNEAIAILEKLKARKDEVSPVWLAVLHAALGQNDAALELLERGYAGRDPALVNMKVTRAFESLRSEPQFQSIMKRVGLLL